MPDSRSSVLINILRKRDDREHTLYTALVDLKNKAKTWYPYASYPGWTNHGEKHVNEVEWLLDQLVPDKMKRLMNINEIFILLAACHWHDFGMTAGVEHRSKHNIISRDSLYDFKKHKSVKKHIIFPIPDDVYAKCVALLCYAHRDSVEKRVKINTLIKIPETVPFHRGCVHLRSLACMLRLADELDMTQQRFPGCVYDEFSANYNKFLQQHKLIRQVDPASSTHEIKIYIDDDVLPYNPKARQILNSMQRKLQDELIKINKCLTYATDERYKLPYQEVELIYPAIPESIGNKKVRVYMSISTAISDRKAKLVLEAFKDAITSTLKNGGKVTLPGFGTFSVAKRKARAAKNPRTGEIIKVPAKKMPKFKAGRELKKAVR